MAVDCSLSSIFSWDILYDVWYQQRERKTWTCRQPTQHIARRNCVFQRDIPRTTVNSGQSLNSRTPSHRNKIANTSHSIVNLNINGDTNVENATIHTVWWSGLGSIENTRLQKSRKFSLWSRHYHLCTTIYSPCVHFKMDKLGWNHSHPRTLTHTHKHTPPQTILRSRSEVISETNRSQR